MIWSRMVGMPSGWQLTDDAGEVQCRVTQEYIDTVERERVQHTVTDLGHPALPPEAFLPPPGRPQDLVEFVPFTIPELTAIFHGDDADRDAAFAAHEQRVRAARAD